MTFLKVANFYRQRIDEPNRKSFSVGFIYPLGKEEGRNLKCITLKYNTPL
jgi:hypothetical protein